MDCIRALYMVYFFYSSDHNGGMMRKIWTVLPVLALLVACGATIPSIDDRISYLKNRGVDPVESKDIRGELHFYIGEGERRCKGVLSYNDYDMAFLAIYGPGRDADSEALEQFQEEGIRDAKYAAQTRDC